LVSFYLQSEIFDVLLYGVVFQCGGGVVCVVLGGCSCRGKQHFFIVKV